MQLQQHDANPISTAKATIRTRSNKPRDAKSICQQAQQPHYTRPMIATPQALRCSNSLFLHDETLINICAESVVYFSMLVMGSSFAYICALLHHVCTIKLGKEMQLVDFGSQLIFCCLA